jgi:PHD/YefM family antitoxin component YafN of YafNO toxin-antitoxin module
MYATYHLSSPEDISPDILEAIKIAFKSKPIVITVEEEFDTTAYLMSNPANKASIDKSLKQLENGEGIFVKFDDL